MDRKLMLKGLKKLPGKWLIPVIAIIWVARVVLRKPSVTTCIILTALLVAGWLIYLLLRWILARGKGEEIEEVPELADFEKRLVKAVNSAKDSPWYLVVGPSGCGKTSLLRNSDIDFSYIDSLQTKPIEQGIEKTRNCDLFYAKDGIILDTTGRYVTSGKEAQARTEWLGLLALLKKHRNMRPVDGLIVTIDIDRLLQGKEGVIAKEAENIRERIVEAISVLGITFPVYLVFTKCDAIYGFTEFFDGMSSADRAQIWGATLRSAQQEDIETAFKGECQRLLESLDANRMWKLGSARGQAALPVYAFPSQFDEVCQKLEGFVSELFHIGAEEKPVFRGFYFTSGAQGGSRPIEFLLQSVAKSLDRQPPSLDEIPAGDTGGAKGYFIKDLFQKVIFPDKGLDRPTSAAERRRTFVRLVISGAAIGILAILTTIFAVSYVKNKNLMTEVNSAALSVSGIRSDTQPMERLARFDRLRKPIIRLENFSLFSFPWQGARADVANVARKRLYLSRYGSAAGAEVKIGRNVEIPVKVFKSEGGELESQEKAEITVVVNGKELDKRLQTNEEGETALKMRVEHGKVNVVFSTDYALTGYEVQRERAYEIQPGDQNRLESVQFIFSKSGRIITVHCVDQFGEDLAGVPVSIIEKADESKKYGPEISNEKGMASLSLEAPEESVLLIYYGDSDTNYSEEQSDTDTLTIQPGETRYLVEKQLRRKLEISVIAFTKATAESQQQPNPGVSISVGGAKLGLTDNSGQWKGSSGIIPTRQNITVDPTPKSMKVDQVASGYSIVLEYESEIKPVVVVPDPVPEPPRYVNTVTESNEPVADAEVWMYTESGGSDESGQMEFESESQKISLALLDSTTDSEGRLELPEEAKDRRFLLFHPDYWPMEINWQQTDKPIQMISIKQERSFSDFSKAQIDGAEHYYQLAQRNHNRDIHKEAIANYQNAIRLAPRLKYYLQLGWAYQEMDQTEAALKQVNIGLELKLLDDPEANEQLLKQQLQELLGLLQ